MASPLPSKRFDSPLRFRRAGREDLEINFEALFALDQACFRPGIAYSRAELRYFLFHIRSASILAEDDTGPVGFAIVQFGLERGRRIGHIITIDVAPDQRRRGIGRRLVAEMLKVSGDADAVSLRLEVAVDNDAAIAFYKLLGFRESGRIPGFYMGRLDALTMERDLANSHPPDSLD